MVASSLHADWPGSSDALIVVDVQRDFLPGGALAVTDGNAVVPVLNHYITLFHARGRPIVATRDWHPPNHVSFVAQGGPWPPHCVQGTPGARFADDLVLPTETRVQSKASDVATDNYSGFDGTGLAEALRDLDCRRLFIGGLATDYCVLHTVLDALTAGFEVHLLSDAIRAVEVAPGDADRAMTRMREAGARLFSLDHRP